MIMDKDQVMGWYANEQRTINKSSRGSNYQARQYRRKSNLEDPWIGMVDHPHDILYGENSWGS